MKLHHRSGFPKKWLGLPRVLWLFLMLIVVFSIAVKLAPDQRSFVNPKIAAEPYVWPEGCKKKRYMQSDTISKNCLTQKYYIGDGQKWGWTRASGWPYYYRVGNDAVMITDVISGIIMSENPNVVFVVNDVFVVQRSEVMKDGQ
jgi:hypothetical protein